VADLKDVLGTWTMLSWKKETIATAETVDVLGPDPVGHITYGADGRMHVIGVLQGSASTRNASAYRYGKATPFRQHACLFQRTCAVEGCCSATLRPTPFR
jgi:hypothetical protein